MANFFFYDIEDGKHSETFQSFAHYWAFKTPNIGFPVFSSLQ